MFIVHVISKNSYMKQNITKNIRSAFELTDAKALEVEVDSETVPHPWPKQTAHKLWRLNFLLRKIFVGCSSNRTRVVVFKNRASTFCRNFSIVKLLTTELHGKYVFCMQFSRTFHSIVMEAF